MDNQLKLLCSNIDDLKLLRDQINLMYRKQSTTSSSTINSNHETTGDEPIRLIDQDIELLIVQMKVTIENGRKYFQTLFNQPQQSLKVKTLLQSHEKVLNDLESFVNTIQSNNLINNQQPSTSSQHQQLIDYPIRPLSPEILINHNSDSSKSSLPSSSSSIIYFDQSTTPSSTQSSQSINKPATIKSKKLNHHNSQSTSIGSSIQFDYKYCDQQTNSINLPQNTLITYQQLTQLFNKLMSSKPIQLSIIIILFLLLILIHS